MAIFQLSQCLNMNIQSGYEEYEYYLPTRGFAWFVCWLDKGARIIWLGHDMNHYQNNRDPLPS